MFRHLLKNLEFMLSFKYKNSEHFMTDIYTVLQKSIENIPAKKVNIISSSNFYSNNGISGIKILIKHKEIIYSVFTGFSNESKYADKLLFGILKSDSKNGLKYLEYDKDENENLIQDSLKLKEKFFKLDETGQIKKLTKWLSDETQSFVILNSLLNKKSKEENNENVGNDENKSEISNMEVQPEVSCIDYSNLTTSQWFKIVELPWLITILSIIPACFSPYIPESNVKANYALLAISSLIFLIGLIGIFLTIDKKKQIREALNLPKTKNPFTWFISRIGKVVCGTIFFCLGAILIFAFETIKEEWKNTVSSSSSSSSSSKKVSNNYSNNNSNTRTSGAIQYYCTFCGENASSISSLTSSTCYRHPNGPYKGHHQIYEGSIKSRYECEYCGQSASSISSLTSSTCYRHPNGPYKGHHKPYIGDVKSTYYCKYCGQSASSISSLTSSTCYRHPNGPYKGYHSPAF